MWIFQMSTIGEFLFLFYFFKLDPYLHYGTNNLSYTNCNTEFNLYFILFVFVIFNSVLLKVCDVAPHNLTTFLG